jgi:uncharacterized cofD-like protein
MDNGGSSGMLRLSCNIVAPGDIGQCILGLHPNPNQVGWLFSNYRLNGGGLHNHTVRNIIVTGAFQQFGLNQEAMDKVRDAFELDGDIAPITYSKSHLNAELLDGTRLEGEEKIYEADIVSAGGVSKLWLTPEAEANPRALEAIGEADMIIICPGTLICSIIPNFLVQKITETLCASRATKIYIANLMNRRGHVPEDWTVLSHVKYLERHLEPGFFDTIIANTRLPSPEQEQYYRDEKIIVSSISDLCDAGRNIVAAPLLINAEKVAGDSLAHLRASVRHHPTRLALAIKSAIEKSC